MSSKGSTSPSIKAISSQCSGLPAPVRVPSCGASTVWRGRRPEALSSRALTYHADMKVDINVHRRHMGMVFQHFNLFNNKTIIQNVMMAPAYLRCQDLKKAKRKNRMISFKE